MPAGGGPGIYAPPAIALRARWHGRRDSLDKGPPLHAYKHIGFGGSADSRQRAAEGTW